MATDDCDSATDDDQVAVGPSATTGADAELDEATEAFVGGGGVAAAAWRWEDAAANAAEAAAEEAVTLDATVALSSSSVAVAL